ncbi:DUF159 family protein [Anaerocolumna cellulosilytica]|uniref:Abasic site processing protein n=1 Tax=Anaerocolumna cellulosilytica TaxID=433286 RepID=A0A6S6R049_9FIRM|nr:SOS response-associated peptidase [Anaerocolumna cellulosilytica]MBB5194116.1 putative SOS response-associated peptidase YedK [Anaerocolumna cellulosilytica]BCJ94669.1 DUF159 family protein [Anaerocolumna cellulosilytica]
MCGRYYVDDETSREIRKILDYLDEKFQRKTVKTGEIFPSDTVPILSASHKKIEPDISAWGFPGFNNKGVLINARAETVMEKKMFRDSVLNRRCVIPANGFYEWDRSKNKYFFHRHESDILYMAGIYNCYRNEPRFVILTTNANSSIEEIHSRMPLILEPDEIDTWILDTTRTSQILAKIPPQLSKAL